MRGREGHGRDAMLGEVLRPELELFGRRALLGDGFREAVFHLALHVRVDEEEVGRGGGENIMAIVGHVQAEDVVTETRQRGFRVFAYLVKQPDITVAAGHRVVTRARGSKLAEADARGRRVFFLVHDNVGVARVKVHQFAVAEACEGPFTRHVGVFRGPADALHRSRERTGRATVLFHHFAALQIHQHNLGFVIGITEQKPAVFFVQHHLGGMEEPTFLVLEIHRGLEVHSLFRGLEYAHLCPPSDKGAVVFEGHSKLIVDFFRCAVVAAPRAFLCLVQVVLNIVHIFFLLLFNFHRIIDVMAHKILLIIILQILVGHVLIVDFVKAYGELIAELGKVGLGLEFQRQADRAATFPRIALDFHEPHNRLLTRKELRLHLIADLLLKDLLAVLIKHPAQKHALRPAALHLHRIRRDHRDHIRPHQRKQSLRAIMPKHIRLHAHQIPRQHPHRILLLLLRLLPHRRQPLRRGLLIHRIQNLPQLRVTRLRARHPLRGLEQRGDDLPAERLHVRGRVVAVENVAAAAAVVPLDFGVGDGDFEEHGGGDREVEVGGELGDGVVAAELRGEQVMLEGGPGSEREGTFEVDGLLGGRGGGGDIERADEGHLCESGRGSGLRELE
mmetsp:Transcript_10168/g.25515  ORF Transcript_10168/g.25515 Transcript_10168/m.25515 type:complete len:617 (+) Transcript_10168:404-2254(+)